MDETSGILVLQSSLHQRNNYADPSRILESIGNEYYVKWLSALKWLVFCNVFCSIAITCLLGKSVRQPTSFMRPWMTLSLGTAPVTSHHLRLQPSLLLHYLQNQPTLLRKQQTEQTRQAIENNAWKASF